MTTAISKILKAKRRLKGEEVGRLLLLNYAHQLETKLNGKEEDLFTQEDFANIESNIINDNEERGTYNRYIHINNWLDYYGKVASGYSLSARWGVEYLNHILALARGEQNAIRTIRNQPQIMTEKQYNEERARRIKETFTDEEGHPIRWSIANIIYRYICGARWARLYKLDISDKMLKILEKYKTEPCKSKYILDAYNTVYKNGVYVMPDGTEVDLDKQAEDFKKWVETKKLDADSSLKCFSLAMLNAENMDTYRERVRKEGKFKPYPLTETVYKADVLEYLQDFYTELSQDKPKDEKEKVAQMEDMYAEFKEIIDEALKEMDAKYDFKPKISTFPVKEWADTGITAEELDGLGFPNMVYETEQAIFDDNDIAVIKTPLCGHEEYLDDKGYFHPLVLQPCVLDTFNLKAIDGVERRQNIESHAKCIEEGTYYTLAFCTAIDLLSEELNMPELKILKKAFDTLPDITEGYEMLLTFLTNETGIYKEDAERHQIILETFRHIRTKWKIPEERINKAREMLKGLNAFKTGTHKSRFLEVLTEFIPEEHTKDGNIWTTEE